MSRVSFPMTGLLQRALSLLIGVYLLCGCAESAWTSPPDAVTEADVEACKSDSDGCGKLSFFNCINATQLATCFERCESSTKSEMDLFRSCVRNDVCDAVCLNQLNAPIPLEGSSPTFLRECDAATNICQKSEPNFCNDGNWLASIGCEASHTDLFQCLGTNRSNPNVCDESSPCALEHIVATTCVERFCRMNPQDKKCVAVFGCQGSCSGKSCGQDDGCGNMCTSCSSGKTCNPTTKTCESNICQASCSGKTCGEDDGCGNKCTSCPSGGTCSSIFQRCVQKVSCSSSGPVRLPWGDSCSSSENCVEKNINANDYCVKACNSGTACASGSYCTINGWCAKECSSHSQCSPLSTCARGFVKNMPDIAVCAY